MVRIKHRYLVLNILFPESSSPSASNTNNTYALTTHTPIPASFTAFSLITVIRASVGELFGDYGVGSIASGLKISYFSPATGTAIVRCPRARFRMVWAGLSFVKELKLRGGRDGAILADARVECVIKVVRVSGTIRKAEEEIVRRARRDIVRMKEVEGVVGVVEKLWGARTGQLAGGNEDEDEGGIEDLSGDEDEMDDDSS